MGKEKGDGEEKGMEKENNKEGKKIREQENTQ